MSSGAGGAEREPEELFIVGDVMGSCRCSERVVFVVNSLVKGMRRC